MVFENFYKIFTDCVNLNKNYIILCKVRYDKDKYIMLGNQIPFMYTDSEVIVDLHQTIVFQMGIRFDEYKINHLNFSYIIIKFIEINKVLLSDIVYDRDRVMSNKPDLNKNILNIPILDKKRSFFFYFKGLKKPGNFFL